MTTYAIYKTDGTLLTDLQSGVVDNLYSSITLVGSNTTYGEQFINENVVLLLENFASTEPPNRPLIGQTWYDDNTKRLKSYNGEKFLSSNGVIVSPTRPDFLAQGDIWIDSANNLIYFADGLDVTRAGPVYTKDQQLSGFKTVTVKDEFGIDHVLLELYVANNLIGVFSSDTDAYTLQTPIENLSSAVIEAGFTPSTIDNFIFNAVFEETNALVNKIGQVKVAENFMFSDNDTFTVGTITVQNAQPLIFDDTTLISANSEIFRFTLENKDFIVENNSATLMKVLQTGQVTLGVDDPLTYDLSVRGNIVVDADLKVDYISAVDDPESLNVKNYEIQLNSGNTLAGVQDSAQNKATSGLLVNRGSEPTVGIIWNEETLKWTLTNNGNDYYNILSGYPTRVAETQDYYDLIDRESGHDPYWRYSSAGPTTYYNNTNNVSIGSTDNSEFKLNISGPTQVLASEMQIHSLDTNIIDISLSNMFYKNISSDTVFQITNVPADNFSYIMYLILENGGTYTVDYWNNIYWPSGAKPALSTGGTDKIGFITYDGGNSWYGFYVGTFLDPVQPDPNEGRYGVTPIVLVVADKEEINTGESVTFTITYSGYEIGETVSYIISGVFPSHIVGGQLYGEFIANETGVYNVFVQTTIYAYSTMTLSVGSASDSVDILNDYVFWSINGDSDLFADPLLSGILTWTGSAVTLTNAINENLQNLPRTFVIEIRQGGPDGILIASTETITVAATTPVTCISVIDESSSGQSYNAADWARFRSNYPTRPFYLLQPGGGYTPGGTGDYSLYIPPEFFTDPYAHGPFTVNRDNGNSGAASDWFTICDLDTRVPGDKVILCVDNSGSMTLETVQASTNLLNQKCVAAGLEYYYISMEYDERWANFFNENFDLRYSIRANTTFVNEGSTVTVTVTSTSGESVPLFWTIEEVSGSLFNAEFTDGSTSGQISIVQSVGSFSKTIKTGDGLQNPNTRFRFQLRNGSPQGAILAVSQVIEINDSEFPVPKAYKISCPLVLSQGEIFNFVIDQVFPT